jgi:hypothetical protein
MIYIQSYIDFLLEKKGGPFTKKLKNPEYMMTDKEVLQHLPNDIPEDLIKFIMSWKQIKKSPYGQSWYSAPKSWDGFIDGEYRVADHWNFVANAKYHCKTIQDPKVVSDNNYWYVGKYNSIIDKYDIVKTYPKESGREYLRTLRKELIARPDQQEIERMRQFSHKIDRGEVKAQLNDGRIVTVLQRKLYKGIPNIKFEKDGEVVRTIHYKLLDEIIDK